MSEKRVAYHEAGHAAANLLLGHGSMGVTIVAKDETLGAARQLDGDDMTAEGMEALIVAAYAGAEAEKRVNTDHNLVKMGASGDDEEAEVYLKLLDSTEKELRERTAKLISEHWKLVELIAAELLLHKTLDGEEVDCLLEVYRGEATKRDLEEFRAMKKQFSQRS